MVTALRGIRAVLGIGLRGPVQLVCSMGSSPAVVAITSLSSASVFFAFFWALDLRRSLVIM